jgi:CRISPR-associated endonuclease/helicase Cas3
LTYAHSLPGWPQSEWEQLRDHLRLVAETCARFAGTFGWAELARVAGLLHDIGKCSHEFQAYIAQPMEDISQRGPDHSTAGACEAVRRFGPQIGQILAFIIAAHHVGLADGDDLARRLTKDLPAYDEWQAHTGPLPPGPALAPTRRPAQSEENGFTVAFLIRMLFSCLVDADRLETADFYARAEGGEVKRVDGTPLPLLRDRLKSYMATKTRSARAEARTETQIRLAELRADILDSAVTKAVLGPGLFTLTVPTGGGKTLASLSFALEHAVTHGLPRVVYVIPFTSIIEQTAGVFRSALGDSPDAPNESDVLEHHASFDWDAALQKGTAHHETGRGTDAIERLQRAAENWDAPIVVTTAVQFFEGLFANRPSVCRKLHNLANSVIVLDEAQTLPLHILRPCLAALDELARNYGASIVICTATQPAWRKIDGKLIEKRGTIAAKNFGLDIAPERELAPDPQRLFTALNRVKVDYRAEPIGDEVTAARFAEQPQMLCVVNSRRHAKALFDCIADLPGAIHLSTWMCPRHRRLVLEKGRADLKAGKPARIVSTSLIEAGVDIDLPEVWRAATGLDSLLQAAGRCNREFRLDNGRLVIFIPIEDKAPHDLKQAWQAGRAVLRRHADPQTLDAIAAYFGELYFNKGADAFDASKLEKQVWPILPHIRERADELSFPLESIAKAFRVIEDKMAPVIVPWSSGPEDTEVVSVLKRIADMDKPLRRDLRRLQQYTVSIPKRQRDEWLAADVLKEVHSALGEAMLCFPDLALYDERSGLRVDEPEHRSPASNIF